MNSKQKHDELMAETSEARQDVDRQELIRRRAYELYEQRGEGGGNNLDDWLQAEAEVRAALGAEDEEQGDGFEETQQRSAYA